MRRVVYQNQTLWPIEKIVSERKFGKQKVKYLIKWEGFSPENSTWEPSAEIRKTGMRAIVEWEREKRRRNLEKIRARINKMKASRDKKLLQEKSVQVKAFSKNVTPSTSTNVFKNQWEYNHSNYDYVAVCGQTRKGKSSAGVTSGRVEVIQNTKSSVQKSGQNSRSRKEFDVGTDEEMTDETESEDESICPDPQPVPIWIPIKNIDNATSFQNDVVSELLNNTSARAKRLEQMQQQVGRKIAKSSEPNYAELRSKNFQLTKTMGDVAHFLSSILGRTVKRDDVGQVLKEAEEIFKENANKAEQLETIKRTIS